MIVTAVRPGAVDAPRYNRPFFAGHAMEAEHINVIAKRLEDVESRAAELRRYL